MSNFTRTNNDQYVNMDHITQVYVLKQEEKYYVVGKVLSADHCIVLDGPYQEEKIAKEQMDLMKW